MCAATPTLSALAALFCGPLVSARSGDYCDDCQRAARIRFVSSVNSSRTIKLLCAQRRPFLIPGGCFRSSLCFRVRLSVVHAIQADNLGALLVGSVGPLQSARDTSDPQTIFAPRDFIAIMNATVLYLPPFLLFIARLYSASAKVNSPLRTRSSSLFAVPVPLFPAVVLV